MVGSFCAGFTLSILNARYWFPSHLMRCPISSKFAADRGSAFHTRAGYEVLGDTGWLHLVEVNPNLSCPGSILTLAIYVIQGEFRIS